MTPSPCRAARGPLIAWLRRIDGEPGSALYAGGAARLHREDGEVIVRPPFGMAFEQAYDCVRTGPLIDELERDRLVGVLLVRLGGYAVGVFDGERLVASKVGTRLVHGRHKKGGSSANRFRRRREEQAAKLHEAAAATALRILEPYTARLDAVVFGGDKTAVKATLAEEPRLAPITRLAVERFLTVPDPRHRVLVELPRDLYAADVEDVPAAP